jgi:hypothetical protein
MHLRSLETASEISEKVPQFPHGLLQGRWGVANQRRAELTATGYLDYCGSVFAATPERVVKAIKVVFELEAFIEYRDDDVEMVVQAILEIIADDLELGRWTVILCPRQGKILVAFEKARAGVEFRLRFPEVRDA